MDIPETETPTSIEEIVNAKENWLVVLSKNPVRQGEILRIQTINDNETIQYEVTDLSGRQYKKGNGKDVDTTGLAPGIYLLLVSEGQTKQRASLKFILL